MTEVYVKLIEHSGEIYTPGITLILHAGKLCQQGSSSNAEQGKCTNADRGASDHEDVA